MRPIGSTEVRLVGIFFRLPLAPEDPQRGVLRIGLGSAGGMQARGRLPLTQAHLQTVMDEPAEVRRLVRDLPATLP